MKLVLDTNLVFSALLKPGSLISELINKSGFRYYAPEFLKTEISKYARKIQKIADYTPEEFEAQKYYVFRRITFLSEVQIRKNNVIKAKKLVEDIDPKDMIFVALTEELKCLLWTGDKKLKTGLEKKAYRRLISTEELKQLIDRS